MIEIEDLKERIETLEEENEELRESIFNIIDRFEKFAEPCAIGHEQLWQIVRQDIQGLPVPNGIDLRDLI